MPERAEMASATIKITHISPRETLPDGKIRTYYVATIESNWDYAPLAE